MGVTNKTECPKEQTHQLGSQLSNTPDYADSPKRHETVILEKTKRTPSLVLYRVGKVARGLRTREGVRLVISIMIVSCRFELSA